MILSFALGFAFALMFGKLRVKVRVNDTKLAEKLKHEVIKEYIPCINGNLQVF